MPAVGYLRCLRGSPCSSIDIGSPTISTHDLHFRVCSQPLLHALCFPIGQQIHNFVRLQVHEKSAKALATSPTPIVHPDDAHLANLRGWNQKQRTEDGDL